MRVLLAFRLNRALEKKHFHLCKFRLREKMTVFVKRNISLVGARPIIKRTGRHSQERRRPFILSCAASHPVRQQHKVVDKNASFSFQQKKKTREIKTKQFMELMIQTIHSMHDLLNTFVALRERGPTRPRTKFPCIENCDPAPQDRSSNIEFGYKKSSAHCDQDLYKTLVTT